MEVEAARRHRKGSEILPPASTDSSASPNPLSFFQPLLNTSDSAKILPSRRNQKLNVVAFISRPHPLIFHSSPSSLPLLILPACSIASTLFSMPFAPPCIGERAFLLSDNSTFLSRKISILHTLDRIAWNGKLIKFKYFLRPLVCSASVDATVSW